MSVHNSEGCVGQCDAKCYMAIAPKCTCICGGKNHGAGFAKALDNTRKYCAKWLKKAKKEHGDDCLKDINPEVWQPSLPFGE
jgi:hypothetical protein